MSELDRRAQALGGGYQLHLRRDWLATREAFGGVQEILAKHPLGKLQFSECWVISSQKLTPQEDLRLKDF